MYNDDVSYGKSFEDLRRKASKEEQIELLTKLLVLEKNCCCSNETIFEYKVPHPLTHALRTKSEFYLSGL